MDTSVLRAFAAIGRLDLLRHLGPLWATPRVFREVDHIARADLRGRIHDARKEGWLETLQGAPSPAALAHVRFLGGDDLSDTDAGIIAIARDNGWPILMRDRRAAAVAQSEGVQVFDLPDILGALKELGPLGDRAAMLDVLIRFETMDGQRFTASERSRLLRFPATR